MSINFKKVSRITEEDMPVGHFMYQYYNLKIYSESPQRIPIYLNNEEFLRFYYSAGAKKLLDLRYPNKNSSKNELLIKHII